MQNFIFSNFTSDRTFAKVQLLIRSHLVYPTLVYPTLVYPTLVYPTPGLSDTGLSDTGLSDTGLSDTGLSDTGLSENLIYLTLSCEPLSLLCVQFTLTLSNTWFIHCEAVDNVIALWKNYHALAMLLQTAHPYSVCMCVYMYIYVYICVCTYVCVSVYIRIVCSGDCDSMHSTCVYEKIYSTHVFEV